MTKKYVGGCLCGSVRYSCEGEPEATFYCHCVDCQKETGGPFSVEIYIEDSTLKVDGTTTKHDVIADSGNKVTREFCGDCGSALFLISDGYPDYVCIKAGSLDDASGLKPEMHIYVTSKLPWVQISDGLPQYEGDIPE